MGDKPLVKLEKISKSFPGVKALTDVSIDFFPGKVHILLGENGAGKSTIIKIISGVYQTDSGKLFVKGNEERFMNTKESLAKGISIIHQELSVIPDLTVAENIYLGREQKQAFGLIDKKRMNQEAKELLDSMGVKIDPRTVIRRLNNGDKQMIEIARAISQNSSMVIMDEPTSSLSDHEVKALFRVIKKLQANNVAIIYISHRLKEITEIGDDITILRDGNVISTVSLCEISEKEMVSLMVGREMTQFYYKSETALKEDVVLEVKNLTNQNFKDINFQLHRGEVLGVAGLIGAGRTEVMRVIFGADAYDSGEIYIGGKAVKIRSVSASIKYGIGLIPEDRRNQGLLLEKNVKQNTSLSSIYANSKKGFIDFKWEKVSAINYIRKMNTKTPSENTIVRNLSGGNQQKIVIAKWLLAESKILIMDEPTRGIDVNAKAEIYNLMKEFVENGGSIILVSSDLPEVLGVSDRILVFREGRLSGSLNAREATEQSIMKLASLYSEQEQEEKI